MARVNAFLSVGNDNGRRVNVGGRGKSDSVWARLNTDNQTGSDVSLYVSAEVSGESRYNGMAIRKTCRCCGYKYGEHYGKIRQCPICHTTRQGIDTLESRFEIELPPADHGATVRIRADNARLNDLAHVGAMLCTIKGIQQTASPDPQARGEKLLTEDIPDILEGLKASMENLPDVTLPGNVDLRYALACVKIVEKQLEQIGQPSPISPN